MSINNITTTIIDKKVSTCYCGSTYNTKTKNTHEATKKHKAYTGENREIIITIVKHTKASKVVKEKKEPKEKKVKKEKLIFWEEVKCECGCNKTHHIKVKKEKQPIMTERCNCGADPMKLSNYPRHLLSALHLGKTGFQQVIEKQIEVDPYININYDSEDNMEEKEELIQEEEKEEKEEEPEDSEYSDSDQERKIWQGYLEEAELEDDIQQLQVLIQAESEYQRIRREIRERDNIK